MLTGVEKGPRGATDLYACLVARQTVCGWLLYVAKLFGLRPHLAVHLHMTSLTKIYLTLFPMCIAHSV